MKNDIARVRRENLRKLIDQHGGPSSLGRRLGHSGPSFLSQMMTGKRPITEKTARAIERKLGLAEWHLDAVPGEPPPFAGTDRALIAAVVRAVGEAVEKKGVKPSSQKFAELVAVVYEHSVPTGKVDQDYLERLISLLA